MCLIHVTNLALRPDSVQDRLSRRFPLKIEHYAVLGGYQWDSVLRLTDLLKINPWTYPHRGTRGEGWIEPPSPFVCPRLITINKKTKKIEINFHYCKKT